MMDEDEEPDEDGQFLHSAMEIVEEYYKGGEISPLMEHLKIPTHSFDSEATNCIYNVLKVIEHGPQSDSLKSFPIPRSSTPIIYNCQTDRTLCYSPTKQISTNVEHVEEVKGIAEQDVPRLSIDSLPSLSIYRSPVSADSSRHSSWGRFPQSCKKCHSHTGTLKISDFLYLMVFGLGASVMFYYFYFPPLHSGPVF